MKNKNIVKAVNLPNKTQLKSFINSRLQFGAKVTKITSYKSDICFLTVTIKEGEHFFPNTFMHVQSMFVKKGIVYITCYIKNDIHGFGSIISENDYFKRFPEALEKTNTQGGINKTVF